MTVRLSSARRLDATEPTVYAWTYYRSLRGAFGYDAEAAVGKPVDELVVPPEKLAEARDIDERVKNGELLDIEVRRRTAEGDR